jgi:hypothetical protein
MTKIKTQSAQAAALIRAELKKNYPEIKFSITSKNYSMGNSVSISWIDAMPPATVEAIADKYQYGHFNGMEDIYEYSNKQDFPQAKYVSCYREISQAIRDKIRQDLAMILSIPNENYSRLPQNYEYFGYDISQATHRLSYSYDFRKGFTGVRECSGLGGLELY